MTDRQPDPGAARWSRPLWGLGGDAPFVYFLVFDADPERLAVDSVVHGVDSVPDGIEAHLVDTATVAGYFESPMGEMLAERNSALAAIAAAADTAILITGSLADEPSLAYLRNCIGMAAAALDAGGVAVLSLQNLRLFGPHEWRDVLCGAEGLDRHLVATLYTEQRPSGGERGGSAGLWVHTRGLRVFGRPDLSLRNVEPERADAAGRLCHVLIDQLVRGLVIADGARMDTGAPFRTIELRRRGDVDDPEFNNAHLEITWGS